MKRIAMMAPRAVLVAAMMAPGLALAAKDSLTLGMTLEPPGLDPTVAAAAAIREVTLANIYEGLVRVDASGAVKPALAESWSVSPDGLTYSFALRKGVTFHDGSAFDSADVKFTFDRAMAPTSTNAQKQIFAPIAAIETPAADQVVIKLKEPSANFLFLLGWGDAVILAPETAENDKTNPVGTGPFKFDRWQRGDRVELSRYPGYWNKGAIKLEKVTFRFISDPQAQVAALNAGDLDAFPNLGAPELFGQFTKNPKFKAVAGNTEGEIILALNNGKPPFDNLKVRQALSYAIDKKSLVEGAYSGFGTPIGSHFSPNHPAYIDLSNKYPYDPAKAKALLAEAGYAKGLNVTLRLPPPAYARRSGEVIAAMLAEVGVQAKIEPIEFAQWLDQVFKRTDYDMTIIAHTEPLDIDIYARDTYYFNYKNQGFKDLIAEIGRTADEKQRNALYGKAQQILADDSVNVFLFQLPKLGVWNAKLNGLWANAPILANDVTGVSWSE